MKQYKFDRSAFKASTFQEAGNHYEYWKDKTFRERLQAANYLITFAYNFSMQDPPFLDRSYFTTRKFKP